MTAPSSCSSLELFKYRTLAKGPRCGRAASSHQRRRPSRHSLPDTAYPRGSRWRRPPGRGGMLQRRNQPGRSGRGAPTRHSGLQCAVLQHPQRRRTGDRRDRHAASADFAALLRGPRRRLGQIGGRQPRGARPTLGIVGYGNIGSQLSTLAEGMGMKVIYYDHTDRLRHGNTEPVESLQICWRKATSSAFMFRKRRPRTA